MGTICICFVIIGISIASCAQDMSLAIKPKSVSKTASPFTVKVLIVNDFELLTRFYKGDKNALLKDNDITSKQLQKLYKDVGITIEFADPLICAKDDCPLPPTTDDPMDHLKYVTKYTADTLAKTQKYDVIIHLTGYFYNSGNTPTYALGAGWNLRRLHGKSKQFECGLRQSARYDWQVRSHFDWFYDGARDGTSARHEPR